MPSKFVLRDFRENSFYHVGNRGIGNMQIFADAQDFRVFMFYLYVYLASPESVLKKFADVSLRLKNHNLATEVKLIAYCLVPSAFRFVVWQKSMDGISKLLKQILNGYTIYYNNKYQRTGGLTAGRFKAIRIDREDLILPLVRHIHVGDWSSFGAYSGAVDDEGFLDKANVLGKFGSVEEFVHWHQDRIGAEVDEGRIRHLLIG